MPLTPSPLKRRLLEMTEQRKAQKQSNPRIKGLKLTKLTVDGDVVAFSVEGKYSCITPHFTCRSVLTLLMSTGETYRPAVKDILMGRGPMAIPKAKFHTTKDVVGFFEGRSAPEQLA